MSDCFRHPCLIEKVAFLLLFEGKKKAEEDLEVDSIKHSHILSQIA